MASANLSLEESRGIRPGSPSPQRRHLAGDGDRAFHIDPSRNDGVEGSPRGIRCSSPQRSPSPALSQCSQQSFHIDPCRNQAPVVERLPMRQFHGQRSRSMSPFGTERTALQPGERATVFHPNMQTTLNYMSPARQSARDSFIRSRSEPGMLSQARSDAVSSTGGIASPKRLVRYVSERRPAADERNPMTGRGVTVSEVRKDRCVRRSLPDPPTVRRARERDIELDGRASPKPQRFALRPSGRDESPSSCFASGTLHSVRPESSPRQKKVSERLHQQRKGVGGFAGGSLTVTSAEQRRREQRRIAATQPRDAPFGLDARDRHREQRHRDRRPVGTSTTWLGRVLYQRGKPQCREGEMESGAAPVPGDVRVRQQSKRSGMYESAATRLSPCNFLHGGAGDARLRGKRVSGVAHRLSPVADW
eukprot:TRINITY_DN47791_c0_g1_i1.p1 TRINITY_DN47791_c0_g1~~TRINITY_DN47791_c0_g1_i1.p1  ORF type:complete len:464 (+),score=96.35 TRINITY_DN47791_c0_g1_i1:133-1392(+)